MMALHTSPEPVSGLVCCACGGPIHGSPHRVVSEPMKGHFNYSCPGPTTRPDVPWDGYAVHDTPECFIFLLREMIGQHLKLTGSELNLRVLAVLANDYA